MPNDDLISRKSALRLATALSEFDEGGWEMRVSAVKVDDLQNIPAEDAKPVRHGKWIEKPYLFGTTKYCSCCGDNYGMPHGVFNFCPNCGAKMDLEENTPCTQQ